MKIFDREPAIIIASVVAIIQGITIFFTSDLTIDASAIEAWAAPVITVLGGFLIRSRVFAPQTLVDAGLDPEDVADRADHG